MNLNVLLNELLISPWYLNGWEFSHKHAVFFEVQKHVPAISVPVPVPDVYLYQYQSGMYKILDQYNSETHLPLRAGAIIQ